MMEIKLIAEDGASATFQLVPDNQDFVLIIIETDSGESYIRLPVSKVHYVLTILETNG